MWLAQLQQATEMREELLFDGELKAGFGGAFDGFDEFDEFDASEEEAWDGPDEDYDCGRR